MKIAIDATLLTGQLSGVEKAILGLVQNLLATARDDTILLYVSRDFDPNLVQRGAKLRRSWFTNRFKLLRIGWNQTFLPLCLSMEKVDVFHAPGYVAPLINRCPTILTVYDCIALTHPHLCRRANRMHYRLMLPESARHARRVIVPTEAVKNDLLRTTRVSEANVNVIPLGISPQFRPLDDRECEKVRTAHDLPEKFILFVGNIEPKKNLQTLLKAFFALKAHRKVPHKLVIAGKPAWGSAAVMRTIAAHDLGEDVRLLGYFPENELAALYNLAELFVLPSIVEGFGFPPLEAMACGTPVVASDVPALHETLGDAASLVDPLSLAELKKAMEDVLFDADQQQKQRAAGIERARQYSWLNTAQQTMDVYREVVDA